MKVLSGLQPWWWAILHAGKRIENRKMVVRGVVRPPTWWRYRGPILLHASKGNVYEPYADACDWMLAAGVVEPGSIPARSSMLRGGIVGRARIVDVIEPFPSDIARTPFLAKRWVERIARDADYRWHMPDQYGFVLEDVAPLPFTPCNGSLGLWEFDERLLKGAA